MSVIEIQGLQKSYRVYQKREGLGASLRGLFHREYRDVQAVRGIDLKVEGGEFVAFLGPNGAGKTTTLKLLSGVIFPTAGSARVLGHVPWKRDNAYRRRFALVMGQKNQLWWDLPASESFRLHQQIYQIDSQVFQRNCDELTSLLGVGHLLRQPVRELSLGERMKMELIAALLHSPQVLFLDEPTIGLDVVAQHNIQQFLRHYQEQRQTTILLTSHYMKDVAALCQRVVIIAQGQIKYDGSLRGIVDRFSRYKRSHPIVRRRSTAREPRPVRATAATQSPESDAADRTAADPPQLGGNPATTPDRGRQRGGSAAGGSDCRAVFASRPGHGHSRLKGPACPRIATWWTILRIALEERLVYRGDFALGTLMRFLPIVTQIFLWSAVFGAMSSDGDAAASSIRGYRYDDFVAYYLLTMVTRAFSSMPGLASGIARQVRSGEIKKFLIQPIDLLGFLLLSRLAHKAAYYSVALLPFALVFFLCRGYFVEGWPDAVTLLAFTASLLMAFVLGFFLESTLGLISFWLLEVSSLLFVYMLVNFFLSGHMFPLDMLPDPWRTLVGWLPLQYLAYFPAAVFLGKIQGADLVRGLLIQVTWTVLFIVASRWFLHRGLIRYSGFGG